MREYETVVIAHPNCSPEQLGQIKERITDVISKHEGQVLNLLEMGNKTLNFPIKKQKKGIYFCFDYTANPMCTAALERMLRYDEQVLRFMSVVTDTKLNIEKRKKEIEEEKIKSKENLDDAIGTFDTEEETTLTE